jgi:Glycosyl transferase family 2
VISDTTPRGSIVTIFLNAERFLDQAMQNVPRQNFTDFARIVVDDGSTDGSTAIARGYVGRRSGRARAIGQAAGARGCAITARRTSPLMKSDQSLNRVEHTRGLGLASPAVLKAPSRQTWLDGPDYLAKTPFDAECLL